MSLLDDLPTPALVLDRRVLTRNLRSMRHRAERLGVTLRPHLKTAKCAEIASLAIPEGGGLTVSTLQEAEWFADRGFKSITYAVGVVPQKLDRVAALVDRGVGLRLIVDDVEAAQAVGEDGEHRGARYRLMIEIDCGGGRGGLAPDAAELIGLARTIDGSRGCELRGVLTHAGQSYACSGPAGIRKVAERERDAAVEAAERIRRAGIECPVVSVGSTPTAMVAENLDGVTEIRPGVYMFFDVFQQRLGVCSAEDIAIEVHASVIGVRGAGRLLVDAGGLALSQDRSTARFDEALGYGTCLDRAGQPVGTVEQVNQEHGFVALAPGVESACFPIGSRIRIQPNHACMTAAMHDCYRVTDDGRRLAEVWERTRGW